MLNVSSEFKTAISASTRKTYSKVIFQIVDTTAKSDASCTVTAENSFSKKDQVFDTIIDMSVKYCTFENDYWLLDGTFSLPPKSTESGYEVGWWSDALCDVNGDFAVDQEVEITFSLDHSSIGISIVFDTDEYAEEFTLVVYDSVDAVIHTEVVTGNTLSTYILTENLTDYRKIKLSITKWVNGYRRARVTEFSFGIIQEYTNSDLIKVSVLEDISTMSDEITSNEVKFTIDNQAKLFNILNPDGIYAFLQRLQKIQPYIGIIKPSGAIEYAKMGTYYLKEWKANSEALTASFMARDIMDVLGQSEYAGATYTTKTLSYIATAIFADYGTSEYEIDSALAAITVSGTLAKMNYREALQNVAFAGKAVVYSDRDGTIVIKQLSDVPLSETLGLTNMYFVPKIELDVLVNTIIVDVGGSPYSYVDPTKPTNEVTLAVNIENGLITTNAHALEVAIWVLGEYKKRFLYEIKFNMNPAYEAGDIVTIQDDFSENKTARITKQVFDFAGWLEGKIYAKGSGT